MTLKQLASEIAKREGKKSEVSIGNIREIIGIFCDIAYESEDFGALGNLIYSNGARRAKRKGGKMAKKKAKKKSKK